ncbi:hypothetical protein LUZ61_004237 [Rhynchospora tenuis]|uniref:Trichome birefringence-like N-terminal domain-containing protein n=1 Tax=Rhynchospora tenuis TaxID=198213 RepID=A0AAD5ZMA7_9POAL|nr:hypothetical protein LUZ61_004237 [Rhynchospora tenuis]
MGVIHEQSQASHFFSKKFVPCYLYTFIPLALLHYYVFPLSCTTNTPEQLQSAITTASLVPSTQDKEAKLNRQVRCDYSEGQWVQTTSKPLYNGTSCGIIKGAQNCMVHGRPDTGFLYWKWQPKDSRCIVPVFDALAFLRIIKNKHLAFVGDSMARNQLESLICLLSTASQPDLVYQDSEAKKFRRWVFHDYNATVSAFWSPFLVKGSENVKAKEIYHNILYLDTVNKQWASELDKFDILVFSNGHWFLHKAMYYEEGNHLLGCNSMEQFNCTNFSFFNAFSKVIHTALEEVTSRFYGSDKAVVVATFTSGHFEGDWDKFGACPKTAPYKEREIEMPYLEKEMRKLGIEEVEMARKKVKEMGGRLTVEALDVTKLALLRPDGHPGPYMFPNPFANGIKERVQNDCVHWCMPGPIDTWNAILLEIMKKWKQD